MATQDVSSDLQNMNQQKFGWISERGWWGLLLLVLICFGVQMTTVTIRGEESRRGRIAWEMAETGDWIVPRIQGGAVFYRPPLQNWLIGLGGWWEGEIGPWAVRIPTFVAMLLTVTLIYIYSRTFLSELGAFTAGASFATFAQVLELGRLGETEGLFTLFVAGGLLFWKTGLNRGWSLWAVWCVGYGFCALAVLTKGPQAPPYFIGPVCFYLILTRNWKVLFSPAHAVGIFLAASIIAAWQIPFALQVGAGESWKIYFRDVGPRFFDLSLNKVAKHMATFPLELILGALLPWSFLYFCFLNREVRSSLRSIRDDVLFCVVVVMVTFPSVWLTPGASLRYYMSIYPFFGIFVGVVVDRIANGVEISESLVRFLRRYWRTQALLIAGMVCLLTVLTSVRKEGAWSQPWWLLCLLLLTGLCAAKFLWEGAGDRSRRGLWNQVVIVAGFLAILNASVIQNARVRISEHADQQIAELHRTLPPGTQMHSLGIVHHLFLFHLREQVTVLPPAESIQDPPPGEGYFCFTVKNGIVPPLPFPWRHLTTINCDRSRLVKPEDEVIVGQYNPPVAVSEVVIDGGGN